MARRCIVVVVLFVASACESGSEAPAPVVDVASDVSASDSATPEPDVATPAAPDVPANVHETVIPEPDVSAPEPDVTPPPPDTAQPSPAPCLDATAPGHHYVKCEGDIGYDVEIPATCPEPGCGLIVDIHGWTMTGDVEDANTDMRAIGTAAGYVVIQPTAPGMVPSWDQAAHAPLVFAFVSEVAALLKTDPKRAHAMGFSQGGGMTWRLLCDHADFFASMSPIGALKGCAFKAGETPSVERPVLAVHGHEDTVVKFDEDGVQQRDALLAAWPFDTGVAIEEDDHHKATRYTTTSGTVFEFWEHDYKASSFILNGHCFPGSEELFAIPIAFGCADSGTFVYGKLALAFFQAHPSP